MIQHFRSED